MKYVVPNRYDPAAENHFYLRSLVVKNRAELQVLLDGRVVKTKKLKHVQPSEMIGFSLKPGELDIPDQAEGRLEIALAAGEDE